jgi:probable dihydroxyacetone kinase regulator
MAQTTKKALAASLKKRLESTTIDKITVKDIVEDCEVNRQTFYYHFHDIYEVLEWIFITEAEKAFSESMTYDTWQQGLANVFSYIKDNDKFVINCYRSLGRDYLEQFLYKYVIKVIRHVIDDITVGINISEKDKQFIADFYKYAFVGIILEWVRMGMKEKPEVIIENLNRVISSSIRRSLLDFEIKN